MKVQRMQTQHDKGYLGKGCRRGGCVVRPVLTKNVPRGFCEFWEFDFTKVSKVAV